MQFGCDIILLLFMNKETPDKGTDIEDLTQNQDGVFTSESEGSLDSQKEALRQEFDSTKKKFELEKNRFPSDKRWSVVSRAMDAGDKAVHDINNYLNNKESTPENIEHIKKEMAFFTKKLSTIQGIDDAKNKNRFESELDKAEKEKNELQTEINDLKPVFETLVASLTVQQKIDGVDNLIKQAEEALVKLQELIDADEPVLLNAYKTGHLEKVNEAIDRFTKINPEVVKNLEQKEQDPETEKYEAQKTEIAAAIEAFEKVAKGQEDNMSEDAQTAVAGGRRVIEYINNLQENTPEVAYGKKKTWLDKLNETTALLNQFFESGSLEKGNSKEKSSFDTLEAVEEAVRLSIQAFEDLIETYKLEDVDPNVVAGKKILSQIKSFKDEDPIHKKNEKARYLKSLDAVYKQITQDILNRDSDEKVLSGTKENTDKGSENFAEKIKKLDTEFKEIEGEFNSSIAKNSNVSPDSDSVINGKAKIKHYKSLSSEDVGKELYENKERVLAFIKVYIEGVKMASRKPDEVGDEKPEGIEKTEYQKAREEWSKKRAEYLGIGDSKKRIVKGKKREYDEAIAEHYSNQSKFKSGVNSVKKFFGFNPELPPELESLQKEYKSLRSEYADSLNTLLKERGKLEGNKNHDEEADQTKIAFVKKFIIKPNQELLDKQEGHVLSESQRATLGRISRKLGKHKWLLRGALVVGAGTVGALTGGTLAAAFAGAALKTSQIGIGIGAGAGAGFLTHKGMQGRVNEADVELKKESGKFDLANIDKLDLDKIEKDILTAENIKDRNLRQQKLATVAASVVAGGAASFGTGMAGRESDIVRSMTDVADNTLSESGVGDSVSNETPSRGELQSWMTAENMGVSQVEELTVPDITISQYSPDGIYTGETNINNITFVTNGDGPDLKSLLEAMGNSDEVSKDINDFVRLSLDDTLASHPNMSASNIQAELFEKFENKFGDEPWWSEANLSKIEFQVEYPETEPEPYVSGFSSDQRDAVEDAYGNDGSEPVPVVEGEVVVEHPHIVEKGDTLWGIMESEYRDELAELSPAEQEKVLGALFEKARAESDYGAEMRSSIGMRSDDVELIYPEEELNLSRLGEELKHLIDQEQDTPVVLKSASLEVGVEADDGGVVPIQVMEQPSVAESISSSPHEVLYDNTAVKFELHGIPDVATEDQVREFVDNVVRENPTADAQELKVIIYESLRHEYGSADWWNRGIIQNFEMATNPDNLGATEVVGNEIITGSDNETHYASSVDSGDIPSQEHTNLVREAVTVFGSEENFVAEVDNFVSSIEDPTYAFYEKWIGGQVSPTQHFQNAPVEYVKEFSSLPPDEVNTNLDNWGINKRTFSAMLDTIDEIEQVVPHSVDTTVGDLIGRYILEATQQNIDADVAQNV